MSERFADLYEKLGNLQWLLHKNHLRTHAQDGPIADPTRGQGRIFAVLKLQDGISTKDLSYLLGIRVSSLNELLAKMEKGGYIKRDPSESDRRVMLVKLTEEGKAQQQKEWNPDDFFACLSEDEQENFAKYLDKLIAAHIADFKENTDDDMRQWWNRGGRERMGDELFERLRSRAGGPPFWGGFGSRDDFGPGGREQDPFGRPHERHAPPPHKPDDE